LIEKSYPAGLVGVKKVLIKGLENNGGECIKKQIKDYIEELKHFIVISPSDFLNKKQLGKFIEENKIDLVLSVNIEQYSAGSNVKDRNLTVGYFTAFIITAPIAAVYAAATEWEGYAVASAEMVVFDTSIDKIIWSKKDSVGIHEKGKSFVSDAEIQKTLLPMACKNLVTKMLNGFLKIYVSQD